MSEFNAQSTAEQVLEGISLAGRVAVITGASSGLGVETARRLAAAGARVVMVARDERALDEARTELLGAVPGAILDTALVDLADLDAVRSGAADILRQAPQIDLLINNAGVMACPLSRTSEGFELQFGCNHLGHFLLTVLLAPALLEAARERGESRVVALSSAGHKLADIDFDDPNFQRRDYDNWVAYGQSKTANALFAVGLDGRLAAQGVRAFAVHPGMIMTRLSRHLTAEDIERLSASAPAGQSMQFKSVEQGAATSVWAASAPSLRGRGGLYLEDCHIAGPAAPGVDGGVESYALDVDSADRLWALSEDMVGEALKIQNAQ